MATTGNSDILKRNTIVIAAPIADFTRENVELLKKALLVAAALLAIGIGLAMLVARLVSQSLSSLTTDAPADWQSGVWWRGHAAFPR